MTLPELGDALPGAERALDRGVQASQETAQADADTRLEPHLVALLEAAGGPDVGNAVRTHLERTRAAGPGEPLCRALAGTADAVLDAAYALHCAATSDLRSALAASGLAPDLDPQDRRRARAEHAASSLAARDAAVRAVLDRLRAR